MPSHHNTNAKGVTPADVQGPGSPCKVGQLSVSYGQPEALDGPCEDQKFTKAPTPSGAAIEIDSPNTPNPMSNTGDH